MRNDDRIGELKICAFFLIVALPYFVFQMTKVEFKKIQSCLCIIIFFKNCY